MKIYSHSQPLQADLLDAFCFLQKGFTDQFVYYDKQNPCRYLGLGRCIALRSLDEVEYVQQGPEDVAPVFFSFMRFDEGNPKPADAMFQVFPNLRLMLPEVVLACTAQGTFLQVNSLGPVYEGRAERFARHAAQAPRRTRRSIPYRLQPDSREEWEQAVAAGLAAIRSGQLGKVVLARRQHLQAQEVFSSKDLLANLVDGPSRGTVFLYRYGDVFFCGCTPELLVRKQADRVQGMCLAGTIGAGANSQERTRLAEQLLADSKNLREHAFVVDFVRQVVERNCHDVSIPEQPSVKELAQVQHLHTPVSARVLEGTRLDDLVRQLHPTPALAGAPVGEARMAIRRIEGFSRGLFGGPVGVVDAHDNGEFSVGIRGGVFDGSEGWLYAGCGIVEGSRAAEEYDEIDLKLETILTAFDGSTGQ